MSLTKSPKWLSVKIGINNASRQHAEGVSTEAYLPIWENVLSTDSHTCKKLN